MCSFIEKLHQIKLSLIDAIKSCKKLYSFIFPNHSVFKSYDYMPYDFVQSNQAFSVQNKLIIIWNLNRGVSQK